MLSILVGRKDITVSETSGFIARVRNTIVKEGDKYVCLQDSQPFQKYDDVEIILTKRFFNQRLLLTDELKAAILLFMEKYHAQEDLSVDCYTFATIVRGMKRHKMPFMLSYWNIKRLWIHPSPGSVVFLVKGTNQFRHAAINIGSGLYISVWGAGGDLTVASLKSMKKDFDADRVVIATPR